MKPSEHIIVEFFHDGKILRTTKPADEEDGTPKTVGELVAVVDDLETRLKNLAKAKDMLLYAEPFSVYQEAAACIEEAETDLYAHYQTILAGAVEYTL